MSKLLTERMAFSGGKIGGTAEAPIIEGVLLCGPTSANRRRYLKKAFEGDRVKRYDGVPVNLNHGRGPDGRPYQEQIGIVQNARHRESDGMPIGDIAVNPKKPYAEAFLWDAKHQPKACGMSHVAHCETTLAADGWEDVTELVRAESVDVISAGNAATTKGLYEATGRRTVAQISLNKFVERFGPKWGAKKWASAQKFCEDLGDVADAPVMDEPPADATEGDLKGALMAALSPMLDAAFESGDSDKAVAALKDFIKLHAKHTGKGDKDTPAADDDDDAGKGDAKESKKPSLAAVVKECTAKGYTADAEDLAVLTEIADPATRAGYIERLKKATEGAGREQPRSGGRTTTTTTTKATEGYTPAEPQGFAKRYRE